MRIGVMIGITGFMGAIFDAEEGAAARTLEFLSNVES